MCEGESHGMRKSFIIFDLVPVEGSSAHNCETNEL